MELRITATGPEVSSCSVWLGFGWSTSLRNWDPISTPGVEKMPKSFTTANLPINQAISIRMPSGKLVFLTQWMRQTSKIMMISLKLVTKDLSLPLSNGF